MTLSGATTPVLSWPGSYGNEEILYIPQRSSFTKASWLFSAISSALLRGILSLCSDAVGVFCSLVWLG